MPELPEVETIVRDLKKKVVGRIIKDVWADKKKLVRNITFENFQKGIKNKKILKVRRRGKYIIIELSEDYILLIHLKMTGRLLLGDRAKEDKYIHLIFTLDNNLQLVYSDLRQFGRIEFYTNKEFEGLKVINELGIEPLSKKFTLKKFKEIVFSKKVNIKILLMNQKLISGIGNIYASEILFRAGVNPIRKKITEEEIKKIYNSIIFILKKAIELNGDSISDYIRLDGSRGSYQDYARVYNREGQKCFRCKSSIEYVKINQRGTYYCPKCQK